MQMLLVLLVHVLNLRFFFPGNSVFSELRSVDQRGVYSNIKFSESKGRYVEVCVELFLHGLVFLIGVDDIGDKGLGGAIDDSPEAIGFRLGLFFFKEFDFHGHEVDLLEQVFYVFVFDIQVGVQTQEGRAIVLL